jgi:glycosyltransferase involved in cell wall biosynthesis
VLLITDRIPGSDSGYGLRVRNVIDGLSAAGRLHVCLVDGSPHGEVLDPTDRYATSRVPSRPLSGCRRLRAGVGRYPTSTSYRRPRGVVADLERLHGGVDWDVVWCSRARVHLVSRRIRSRARIVDLDDLGDRLLDTMISDRRHQEGALRSAPRNVWDLADSYRWRRLQRAIAASVDRVVVCSENDRRYLGVENAAVVPNGYPDPGVRRGRTANPPSLLFVGLLSYQPNRLAVEWLAREIVPRVRARVPDAELVVVGRRDGVRVRGEHTAGVRVVGWVPDVTPYYERATVAVTPLHSGGGTRLKVIEALARRVPLVSTTFGCEGIELSHGEELVVADHPVEFAAACIELLGDPVRRARLAEAGRRRYERHLTSAASSAAVRAVAADALGLPATTGHPPTGAGPPDPGGEVYDITAGA